MNTSLTNNEPKLLVDLESGRVLRGDDSPIVSRRWADTHPFIVQQGQSLFVGPEAERRARARKHSEAERHFDAWEYEITDDVAGFLRLQRVERG